MSFGVLCTMVPSKGNGEAMLYWCNACVKLLADKALRIRQMIRRQRPAYTVRALA